MARKLALLPLLIVAAYATAGDLTLEVRDPQGTPMADAVVYAEPINGDLPPPFDRAHSW
jgi:hypothetical protein